MRRIIELLREVQKIQRKMTARNPGESVEDFESRIAAEEAEVDEWIGTLYYKANSVSWSHSKSVRYKNDLEMVWDALREIGVQSDGKTHAADAIRSLKVPVPS